MAKPIEATPILKGSDLASFAQSLNKKDSVNSQQKRKSALSMLKIASSSR